MNLFEKLFGKVQYRVTCISVDGTGNIFVKNNKEELDSFVEITNYERYWMVKSIEKIRTFDYKYSGKVYHQPLWFSSDGLTEEGCIDGTDFRFLIKDDSLTNIQRVDNVPVMTKEKVRKKKLDTIKKPQH